jgi:hypothetical protein
MSKSPSRSKNIYVKLLLKPFLGGILWGLFMGMLGWWAFRSFVKGMVFWLGMGVLFGLVLSFLNFLHISIIRRRYGKSKELLKAHHTREVELSLPYDDAFDRCEEALKSLKCREIQENRYSGKIVAKKPPKIPILYKYPDLITIELYRVGDSRTKVKISSRPFFHHVSVDYGSNLENVEKITSFLKKFS